MAVLAQHESTFVVVDSEDHHGAGMLHDHPSEGLVLSGDAHLVEPDREGRRAPPHVLARVHRPGLGLVAQLHRGRGSSSAVARRTPASPTGISSSFWRSMAAPTSPAKSGCGRVGRDLSSGWAWVET